MRPYRDRPRAPLRGDHAEVAPAPVRLAGERVHLAFGIALVGGDGPILRIVVPCRDIVVVTEVPEMTETALRRLVVDIERSRWRAPVEVVEQGSDRSSVHDRFRIDHAG